jgi:hypothetical protein
VTPLDLLIGILCFSLFFDLSLTFNNTYIALMNYVQHWFLSRHKLHLSFIIYGLTFSYQQLMFALKYYLTLFLLNHVQITERKFEGTININSNHERLVMFFGLLFCCMEE